MEDIIGSEYCGDDQPENEERTIRHAFASQLSKKDMRHIREGISKTTRPTWHAGPPPNLGMPAHGKLKADQWRSIIEFDLPVSLVRLLVTDKANKLPEERLLSRELQVRSTMSLATAIRWGTSHRTSTQHATEYKRHILEYLRSFRQLCPDRNLVPNQHNAVHWADFLPLFGPAHGWWMFPFERVIGLLQKIKSNLKLGKQC